MVLIKADYQRLYLGLDYAVAFSPFFFFFFFFNIYIITLEKY